MPVALDVDGLFKRERTLLSLVGLRQNLCLFQCLFRELPHNGTCIEFLEDHGQFNNGLNNNLTGTKKQL